MLEPCSIRYVRQQVHLAKVLGIFTIQVPLTHTKLFLVCSILVARDRLTIMNASRQGCRRLGKCST